MTLCGHHSAGLAKHLVLRLGSKSHNFGNVADMIFSIGAFQWMAELPKT